MRVDSLVELTGARLSAIGENATLQVAALALSNPGIGLVVVRDGTGAAIGVISKSDLVRHLAWPDPASGSVPGLMSRTVVSCAPQDELRTVWRDMTARRLQNIPVLDHAQRPVGVLDIRDALKALLEAEEMQEHLLADYIAGVGYR